MKLRLNERQYNLLTEQETESHYGLNKLMGLINKGDKILISGNDDPKLGDTVDLPIDSEDKSLKIISIDGDIVKVMFTDTKGGTTLDFGDFDNGLYYTVVKGKRSSKGINVTAVKKLNGNNIVAYFLPNKFNPEKQAQDDKDEVDSERDGFIDKLKGFSDGDGIEFKGKKNIEFKVVGDGSNSSVRMKPVSKEFKIDKEAEGILIRFDDIAYDKGSNEITLKYYEYNGTNVMSSKEIGGITGLGEVASSDNEIDSEELEEIKGYLARGDVDEIFKIGEYKYTVTQKYGQGIGVIFKPANKETNNYIIGLLGKGTNKFVLKTDTIEEKDDGLYIEIHTTTKKNKIGPIPIDSIESLGKEGESDEDDTKDDEALDGIKDKLSNVTKGEVITFGDNDFIVVKVFKTKKGPNVVLKPKDINSVKFLKSKLNEDKNNILDKYQFTVDISKIKSKGGDMVIPMEINGKIHKMKTPISGFTVAADVMGKKVDDKKKKDDATKKEDKLRAKKRRKDKREAEKVQNMKAAAKLIRDNPRLIRAIKNGTIPAKEVLTRVEKRLSGNIDGGKGEGDKGEGDKGDKTWIDKFKNTHKVNFAITHIDDKGLMSELKLDERNNFATVDGKDKTKVILMNKKKGYKIFLSGSISTDEFSGKIAYTNSNGIKQQSKIEIDIKEYNSASSNGK